MCLNAFDGAGMEEYADIKSGSAEVTEVKTGADSGSKQVNTVLTGMGLFDGIQTAVKRRDLAGNGTYTCAHEIADLLPLRIIGRSMKAVAGQMQCVQKVAFRFSHVAGKSERSRRNAEM